MHDRSNTDTRGRVCDPTFSSHDKFLCTPTLIPSPQIRNESADISSLDDKEWDTRMLLFISHTFEESSRNDTASAATPVSKKRKRSGKAPAAASPVPRCDPSLLVQILPSLLPR